MKILLYDILDSEIKDFLLTQEGIEDVMLSFKDSTTEINIKYNDETNPIIIMKYIELFQKYKYSFLLEFNKGYEGEFKVLKYNIDDICCEYCYMSFVMDLFENEFIKSVKSNFDFNKHPINVEFLIEYSNNYNINEIKKLKEKYIN